MAVKFRYWMIQVVKDLALSGLTSNEDIAEALTHEFGGTPITKQLVATWRKQHPKFEAACAGTLIQAFAMLTREAFTRAMDGDTATLRWFLERRSPAFMPKSKTDFGASRETLDDLLGRRASASEDELRKRGIIADDDEYE